MKKQNYQCSITASITPEEAFDKINDVSGWWAKNIEGNTEALNESFTVHFDKTFVTFKVTEFIPGKKIVWQVTDCYLHWINDKTEWTGTKVIFEISSQNGATKVDFTHVGLLPEVECYNDCVTGWDYHLKTSFFKLLTKHQGLPV